MPADQLLRDSEIPVWKRLINSPLTTDERVSLITDLFSDPDETNTLKALSKSDAQSVINVMDGVLVHSHIRITGPLT